MNNQKILWEKLAKENSKYYINSDKGRGITEAEFRQSGADTYKRFITDDELIKNRQSILDFGCGNGRLTEYMAKDFKKVFGVDISRTMILEARERLKNLMNVYLTEIDGQHIPLPDGSINIVFSYLVFQHIKTREMVESAFADIYRVLTPGGIFKVLLRSDKQKDMNRWWSGVAYSENSIAKVYAKIGFKMLKIEHVERHAYWLWVQKYNSMNTLKAKWERGKNNTLRFYREKLPWKERQFNHAFPLYPYFGPMIGSKKEVKIADIGSGMFCTIGSTWPDVKVEVYPSDALAAEFNQILAEARVKVLIPVKKENMENLSYKDNFFDIVNCCNALDHTTDPIKALSEMYRTTKPGGFIYLRHFPNVGENEGYQGLHIWNIDIDKNGEGIIWNRGTNVRFNDIFNGFRSIRKKEMDYETEDLVVSIYQKSENA